MAKKQAAKGILGFLKNLKPKPKPKTRGRPPKKNKRHTRRNIWPSAFW